MEKDVGRPSLPENNPEISTNREAQQDSTSPAADPLNMPPLIMKIFDRSLVSTRPCFKLNESFEKDDIFTEENPDSDDHPLFRTNYFSSSRYLKQED